MNSTNLPNIHIKRDAYKGVDALLLYFKYNDDLLKTIRSTQQFRWSKTMRCWHTFFSKENLETVKQVFGPLTTLIEDESIYRAPKVKTVSKKQDLSPQNNQTISNFIKYLYGKCYSKSTVDTYSSFVADFLHYIKDKPTAEYTVRDVEKFIEDVMVPKNASISSHRQFISAMKLFIGFMPDCTIETLELERPKKSRYLPTVLSQQEMLKLLKCTKNLKHRAILALIYSCGLRVGELINLELSHIDINRKQLAIKNSKGRKDRYVQMADSLLPLIHNYIHTYRPVKFFAEGNVGECYSAISVRAFLKRSCKLACIEKRVTPHTLRHSYATHLLENGTDIRLIQTLLGHSKPETTMIYTHVSTSSLEAISNPLDIAVKKYLMSPDKEQYLSIGPGFASRP